MQRSLREVLQMAKVIAGKYPEDQDWQRWINFSTGAAINRVFLWRLTAYVRDIIKEEAIIGWGIRTIERQAIAYQNYLNGGTLAAKPGNSWHNYGFAVDFNRIATVNGKGVYPGTINADYLLFAAGKGEQSTLEKYGLCHVVTGEPWHIQPVETRGYTEARWWFADLDDWVNTSTGYPMLKLTPPVTFEGEETIIQMRGAAVKELQRLLNFHSNAGLREDGWFGEATDEAVRIFQDQKGLTVDGKVGPQSWVALLNTEPPVDYETLYHEATQEIEELNKILDDTKSQLTIAEEEREELREELWENASAVRQILVSANKYQ